MEAIYIFLFGLVLDAALGEPPNVVHPVSWLGKIIAGLAGKPDGRRRRAEFLRGIGVVIFTIALFTLPVYFLLGYLAGNNSIVYIIVGALVFKATFAIKGMRQAALGVKALLESDRLDEARFDIRSLVGRDTARLDRGQLVSAVVESIAENSCDSVVAPFFYFILFGVPGAVAYRVINTLDNMIGHHGEWEYMGKFAARLDTIANFIPARITALIIILAAGVRMSNAGGARRIMRRDRNNTASPNAGWTMSAMAGALNVRLEKPGFYQVGDDTGALAIGMIDKALGIMTTTALVFSLVPVITGAIYYAAA